MSNAIKFKKSILVLPVVGLLLSGCTARQSLVSPAATPMETAAVSNVSNVGRYITAVDVARPDQVNPLLTVATFKFSPSVQTIGDAINQVLQYSGYALVPSQDQSAAVEQTLAKPLPYSVRTLGPLQIKDALTVLMGQDVFILVIDPLHRLVNFDLNPDIKNALYPSIYPTNS